VRNSFFEDGINVTIPASVIGPERGREGTILPFTHNPV
jgi:hypothetical protein